MDNRTMIKDTLSTFYHETSATDEYIAVFNLNGTVIASIVSGRRLFETAVKLDKASRGAGFSIRFKPNKSDKLALMTGETFVLCSIETFNEMVKESKYNKGEIAEKLVTEHFGQTWVKDNVPYTEDGDITVNGVKYQIKYEKATFITEKQMIGMKARG